MQSVCVWTNEKDLTEKIIKRQNRNMLKITDPKTGAQLQVADNDFFDTMTWIEATKACSDLGVGWRLPTLGELYLMYYQLRNKGKGNFTRIEINFWSSSKGGEDWAVGSAGYMWTYPLHSKRSGYYPVPKAYPPDDDNFKCFVRAVRDI